MAVGLVLLGGACGSPHMGEGYGRRVRAALDAQIARGASAAIILGDDAKTILMRHRGLVQSETRYQSRGLGGAGATSSGSGPGAMSPGGGDNPPPPRLDAVR